MSERDLIQERKLAAPVLCKMLYVCKYRQLHMCDNSCDDYLFRTNGTCQKTGVYHGHPESGFMRNPTYKVVKNPSVGSRLAANKVQSYTTAGTFISDERSTLPNFAKAMVCIQPEQEKEPKQEPESKRRKVKQELVDGEGWEEEEEEEEEDDFWGVEYKLKMEKKRNASESARMPFRKKKEPTEQALDGHARDIIRALFYSRTRDRINEEKRVTAAEGSKRQIKAYRQQKKEAGSPWFIHDVLKIDANERLVKDHMSTMESDEALVSYFASVIVRSWFIVNDSPWGKNNQGKIKFVPHCLGVLYYMRRGYEPHGVIYIPRHDYMMNLPLVNDLKSFGYPKNGVKSGMKVITNAYESARKSQWTNSQLRMENREMSRNHGKVSKLYG